MLDATDKDIDDLMTAVRQSTSIALFKGGLKAESSETMGHVFASILCAMTLTKTDQNSLLRFTITIGVPRVPMPFGVYLGAHTCCQACYFDIGGMKRDEMAHYVERAKMNAQELTTETHRAEGQCKIDLAIKTK